MDFDLIHKSLVLAQEKAKQLNRHVLSVTRLSIDPPNILDLLEKNKERSDINLWLGNSGYSLIGFGIAHELIAKGINRFSLISDAWKALISDAITTGNGRPIAIGGFRFDTHQCHSELWKDFPDAVLTIPSILIYSHSIKMNDLIISDLVNPQSNIENRLIELRKFWTQINSKKSSTPLQSIVKCNLQVETNIKENWSNLVRQALDDIRQQKLIKVVIARSIHLKTDQPISLSIVINKLRSNNPKACIFAFGRHHSYFVGATPEILFSAKSGYFQTMALAGTAPRGNTPEEDSVLGSKLLRSIKDVTEHALVVNTIKDTLTSLCSDIHMDDNPSLHKLPNVQHLITNFKGQIKSNKNILDIISQLHPTPAVGGIPSKTAMSFLRDHEKIDRGWYAGPVGWIDSDGNGEFMVALRSGLFKDKQATLFAGCGIVAGSECESEFQETHLKFTTMINAIKN
ncbi:Isochorismate synthase EntC (MenF) (PDB:5JXZ) [Commensalibacter communis]|uniref:isochorismate synthase n=1 Tax=Commensalibacter communis TaxID=2972786 RepID=UPI0022FF5ADF|nr:isochorismate synthase [Commensalibacter communis]CAI3958887.1 Isochorismate synthase EntC (MenF) (PDB:5JXZ) [Commensalibacter communis]